MENEIEIDSSLKLMNFSWHALMEFHLIPSGVHPYSKILKKAKTNKIQSLYIIVVKDHSSKRNSFSELFHSGYERMS